MNEIPIRIQRKRTKGWKMPPNTKCVTRPGPFGNPFAIGKEGPLGRCPNDASGAVGFFRAMIGSKDFDGDEELREDAEYPTRFEIRRKLRGFNLACFCPIGSPCHADILLEIANA